MLYFGKRKILRLVRFQAHTTLSLCKRVVMNSLSYCAMDENTLRGYVWSFVGTIHSGWITYYLWSYKEAIHDRRLTWFIVQLNKQTHEISQHLCGILALPTAQGSSLPILNYFIFRNNILLTGYTLTFVLLF